MDTQPWLCKSCSRYFVMAELYSTRTLEEIPGDTKNPIRVVQCGDGEQSHWRRTFCSDKLAGEPSSKKPQEVPEVVPASEQDTLAAHRA